MRNWVMTGLATGVKTTRYPTEAEAAAGVSPGLPVLAVAPGRSLSPELIDVCPTRALADSGHIDYGRCVHCFRCARSADAPVAWSDGYEWADLTVEDAASALGRAFRRSLFVRVVDSGDCGACLNEIRQLNGPYYNAHRLGLFITPTPRKADALIVVGPVTEHMRVPLEKAYAAMPEPKRVIAVGACALSGGVFGPSFAAGSGAADVVPVDVSVPGCPPPPLALMHALLVVVGRKPPSRMLATAAPASVDRGVPGGAS
jgi:Ni,Fe-hydrogenase III small subunit